MFDIPISTKQRSSLINPVLLQNRDVARTFKGGSPADTNNYDRFDVPIALNTREV